MQSQIEMEPIEGIGAADLALICEVLGCEAPEVRDFSPINEGLTNQSYKFSCRGKQYVYRTPGAGTDEIISRQSETFSQGIAKVLGIDNTFLYEDPDSGRKLSVFVEGCVPFDYDDERHVTGAMELVRKLHGCGERSEWSFDVYAEAISIVGLVRPELLARYDDYDELLARAQRLNDFVRSDEVAPVICHNDFYAPNILVHDGGMDLIDWEYSAMGDYASDLGTFICCSDYTLEEAARVIGMYFGRTPERVELRHCMAYVGLSAFYWFVWAVYKEQTGDPVGDWLEKWHEKAAQFGKHAEGLYLS